MHFCLDRPRSVISIFVTMVPFAEMMVSSDDPSTLALAGLSLSFFVPNFRNEMMVLSDDPSTLSLTGLYLSFRTLETK